MTGKWNQTFNFLSELVRITVVADELAVLPSDTFNLDNEERLLLLNEILLCLLAKHKPNGTDVCDTKVTAVSQ